MIDSIIYKLKRAQERGEKVIITTFSGQKYNIKIKKVLESIKEIVLYSPWQEITVRLDRIESIENET